MKLDLPDGRSIDLARPAIVGILNLTPDSFSDGGRFCEPAAALDRARRMIAEGADAIDVGGESTRPGAERIEPAEQIRRIVPSIEAIAAETDIPISVDTTRYEVAEAALGAGAVMLNDISAGREDPRLLDLAAQRRVPVVLMHMQGTPATMQKAPKYRDVVREVADFLIERRRVAVEDYGLDPQQIALDPGIGFGKSTEHNLTLLRRLGELSEMGSPLLLGASRKRFLGEVCGIEDPAGRVAGTAATTAIGVAAGVKLFRVHDVGPNRQAADVTWAVIGHPNA